MATLVEAIQLSKENNRVCPIGHKWKRFYEFIKQTAGSSEQQPPEPIIGRAWWQTPNDTKARRFHEQLAWANQHGIINEAYEYLAVLQENSWHIRVDDSATAKKYKSKGSRRRNSSMFNKLEFIRDEISEISGIDKKPKGGVKSFSSKIGYALSLGLKEKEIFVFGLLQWASIALTYLLWIQMLDWIPDEVWRSTEDSDSGSIADLVLLAWSFACVGLASFPVGILTGCMGATHFLHKQGRESTIATCLKLVLPQSWALWSFHWVDGWITVNQILERLPSDDDKTTPAEKAASEAIYYAWKIGISGVLPSIVTGKGLVASGRWSVRFVKEKFVEIAKLRAGYSALCWIIGVTAYVGMIILVLMVNILPDNEQVYSHIYDFYLWAAVPILISLAIVMLLLRPIYVLALCDLYSDFLTEKGIDVDLPENPPLHINVIVAFLVMCIFIGIAYFYRVELGIVDMLSTPYGQEY